MSNILSEKERISYKIKNDKIFLKNLESNINYYSNYNNKVDEQVYFLLEKTIKKVSANIKKYTKKIKGKK